MSPRNPRSNLAQSGAVEGMGVMRLELHQLEHRLEHLRVRRPERQRRLLASLAASGQQTPIVMVAAEQPDRYLVIDGYLTLKPEQSNIFFKLMEERYHRHSTIITTNLSYDEWGNFLGNPTMVDALLSRVRHYCHTIRIDGPSLRDPQG